jgi:hypothetical protein
MISGKGQTDWASLAQTLFDRFGKKTAHVSDLTKVALPMELLPAGETAETFSVKLGGYFSRNATSKTPQVSKAKNAKGGYLRGVYKLRSQKAFDLTPAEIPIVSTQFTGSAGEFAVMSELLFRGYNASKMTVDDGIDIVASKDEKYFHIQVKTANATEGKPFVASIKKSAFRHAGDVFYILVMREPTPNGFVNRYAIFPSSVIHSLTSQGVLKDGVTISLRIMIENTRYKLNGSYDASHHINAFRSIC